LKNDQHEVRAISQAKAKLTREVARTKNNMRTGKGQNGVYRRRKFSNFKTLWRWIWCRKCWNQHCDLLL